MVDQSASVDSRIALIARKQHGIVTTAQLVEVGLTKSAISKRARCGRLYRIHRGVYSVGHDGLDKEARWMAAVLACGAGAVLSHGPAAVHWGLLRPLDGPIDITIPTQNGRCRRNGVRIHRCGSLKASLSTTGLPKRLATVRDHIPVTTVPRTLVDIRATLPPRLVRRAVRQAEFLGLGLGEIKTDRTRSDLERYFLRLWRGTRLWQPEVNVPIDGMTVDFLWRRERLVVETDSYATHGGTVAFENDRERDLRLRRLGYSVHHFSERQLEAEPEAVIEDVASALRHARAPGAVG
ncbi:MAG TPA: type IV toxin-antitoxin system AbiEi family antitoxin domain-containing protein [Solirubrobacterales bacterium]|nr:type IV toxin-antitoxin system AbiEi family antitoxin domain-containing protein [Solirubrobacterales bacterium]